MDRMPFDPAGEDALYEQSPEVFPPDASNAVAPQHLAPSQPDTGATPAGDDTPDPAALRAQLESERQARLAAEARARQGDEFQANLRRMAEQHQETTLEQQWATFQEQIPDLSPEDIRQKNAWFMAQRKQRETQWKQQAEQVHHQQMVVDFKREFVNPTMPDLGLPRLTPAEAAELDTWDRFATQNPDIYIQAANAIVARRTQLGTLEQRLAALERDTEAEEHIASGIHRVGGSGGGRAARGGIPDTDYDASPWSVVR